MKYLTLLGAILAITTSAHAIYKDPGIAPDMCPVKDILKATITDVFNGPISFRYSRLDLTEEQKLAEKRAFNAQWDSGREGCFVLKTIYTNNLLSSLELDIGENRYCNPTRPAECSIVIGKDEMLTQYHNYIDFIKTTQKQDVRNSINNNNENIAKLIINQLQYLALEKYNLDSVHKYALPKVNQNLQALGVDLVLKGYELDIEKTNICTDYDSFCPMMMNDPDRAPLKCKAILEAPRPAFCSQRYSTNNQVPQAPTVQAQAAPVGNQLTEAQAQEYLNLNLDVKKAFETKPTSDTRTLIQFASQHYNERSEVEGRPRSVKEYIDCNPADVGLGFRDRKLNTNEDEAKDNIVAFVAKHFQYLIQPKMPVSSRNFKTFGCMDLDRYLICYKDVRAQCSNSTAGKVDAIEHNRICAFNHYRDYGKREGRDGVSNCQN